MRLQIMKPAYLVLSSALLSLQLPAYVPALPEFIAASRQLNRSGRLAAKPCLEPTDALAQQLEVLELSFKHCLATVPTQQPEARQRCQDAYTTALITQYHCVPAFLLIKHAVNLRHLLETQTQQPADPQPTIAERAAQHALAAKIIEWQAYDKANSWW